MTALKEYDRLESSGLWRLDPKTQRQNVNVSFGKATLVIRDSAGRPLSHWSLPAVQRQKPYKTPALYHPDQGESEELEIEDTSMIEAIETVRKALTKDQPRPGLIRWLSTLTVLGALATALTLWFPDAVLRQTLVAAPGSKRVEIGQKLAQFYQKSTGEGCVTLEYIEPLNQFQSRLFGRDYTGQLVVVQHLPSGAVTLPGFITLLDRYYLETFDDPAVPAGYLVAANAAGVNQDPLEPLLRHAGLWATLKLLTQGEISDEVLHSYAVTLDEAERIDIDKTALQNAFRDARLPLFPYVQTRPKDFDLAVLNDESHQDAQDMPILVSDQDWVRLQNICLMQ